MTRIGLVVGFTLLSCAVVSTHEGEKDYTKVRLADLGVTLVIPKKDAKTGFVVGGKNATDALRKLTEINGRSIADLEKDMRPGAGGEVGSGAGFLGKEEKLLEVLAMDNAYVVDKLGLTHQELARHLHIVTAIGMTKRFDDAGVKFTYHGQQYHVKMICYKGFQESPFYDNTRTSCDCVIENLTAKKTLKFSPLVPHMMERYGFYEGKGTSYRVEPDAVLAVFPFLKERAKKE